MRSASLRKRTDSNGTTSLPGEDVPGLLAAMSPRQREAYEAARAAEAGEAVVTEIDHDEPLELDPDTRVYLA